MKIRLHKRKQNFSGRGSRLCFSLLYWYVISGILVGFFGFPRALFYLGDLINLWAFVHALVQRQYKMKHNGVLLYLFLFSLTALISGIANLQSLPLLLWGIRQNFRFFLYYYTCTVFLRREDYARLFALVKAIFWASAPLCVYEALFVTYPYGTIVGDMVGGIYYNLGGVSGILNVILVVHVGKTLVDYCEKRLRFRAAVLTLGAAFAMAALGELKVFLLEGPLMALGILVYYGANARTLLLAALGTAVLGISADLFIALNGRGRSYYTSDLISLSGLLEVAFRKSGYDGTGDLNRFSAVPVLAEKFFRGDLTGLLLGIGLGNGDYSKGFGLVTSPFYRMYRHLHYQYFSVSFVFIETGLIGLGLYCMIFLAGLGQSIRYLAPGSPDRIFSLAMCLEMLVLVFYNPTLRGEQTGFLLYMLLAFPAVCRKEAQGRNRREAVYDP